MRVLVTGASGFIGRALVARLVSEGMTVRAAGHRREPPVDRSVERVAVGPVTPDTEWRSALADVDAVVHLAARAHILREAVEDPDTAFARANADATARLAHEGADAGVQRLVLLSSIGVNGATTDGRAPFRYDDTPAPEEPYARSKLAAERRLHEAAAGSGLEAVIVRPPLVYGPGAAGNFARLVRWVARGVPLPLAAIDNRRSLIGRDNLVDLLVHALDCPRAAGATLLAADGEELSTAELIRRLSAAAGRRARLFPVPTGVLRALASGLGRRADAQRLLGSLRIDSQPTCELLGWQPPLTVDQGLARVFSDNE